MEQESLSPREKVESALEGKIYCEAKPLAGFGDEARLYQSEISDQNHTFAAVVKNPKAPTGETLFFINCDENEAINSFKKVLEETNILPASEEHRFWTQGGDIRTFADWDMNKFR